MQSYHKARIIQWTPINMKERFGIFSQKNPVKMKCLGVHTAGDLNYFYF